jgi:phycocyanobilin:ferredoxin oxidoreductase
MNFKTLLDLTAKSLEDIIIEVDGVKIETEDFGWSNIRYISDSFRIAHIERYSDRGLEVLHFTCFPHVHCGDPIFGFDIICTKDKPLAAFLDLSPVLYQPDWYMHYDFKKEYPLPEWAENIFSNYAVAVIPQMEEVVPICNYAVESFEKYVKELNSFDDDPIEIVKIQNYYCDQQLRNERTFNVLKAKLGEERARYFMENILFPKVET